MEQGKDVPHAIDRRTAPRTSTRAPVELILGGWPAPLPARAVDIGPSGICVATPSRLPLREVKALRCLVTNRQETIRVEARWQRLDNAGRGHVAGLQFVDVDERVASGLRSHVYETALGIARFLLERTHLAGLQMDDAIDAALLTRAADYAVGRRIYEQGKSRSRGDSLFIVEKGSVVREAQVPGAGRTVLDTVEAGGIFAGLPLLAEMPHSESAIAATEVALLEIDPYSLASLESIRPPVARRLRRAALQRWTAAGWPRVLERVG